MPRRPVRSLGEFEDDPRVERYLGRYTDPAGCYAFVTYDQAPIHGGPVTAGDVLMANLLSLRLGWEDVIPLFALGEERPYAGLRRALDEALDAARRLPALECCTAEEARMPSLRSANEIAYAIEPHSAESPRSWTAVTVSKVLHRLSRNIPIIDSRVRSFYGSRWAGIIRARLHEDLVRNRGWMTPIAERYAVRGDPLPLTRMADILIWMDGEAAN